MLKTLINKKVNEITVDELVAKLGYNSKRKAQDSLNRFLNTESIYTWFYSGFYDLRYNAKEFLFVLTKALDIDMLIVDNEISEIKKLKKEIDKFRGSYIFVNTNFKRKNEPIFALCFCERSRRISLYKNKIYIFKTLDKILNIVSEEIKRHYAKHDGSLCIWGDIVNYQLNLFDDIYTFETNGKITSSSINYDSSIATLKLKNKTIL